VGTESWQPFERQDHWKERAYFLAASGACKNKPQFHTLVQAIYNDGLESPNNKDGASDLYTQILRVDPKPTPFELGTLIASLDLHHLNDEHQGGPSCEAARQEYLKHKEEDMEIQASAAAIPEPIVLLVNDAAAAAASEWNSDPSIIAYRTRELIPPTFPVQKVIQQMILTHLGAKVPSNLLSSVQRRSGEQPEKAAVLGSAVFEWIASLPFDKLASQIDITCPQLQSYYFGRTNGAAGQPITPHALIQGVIQDERHRKLWPNAEPSVVKIILEI
jgi:hypothetical protein